MNNLLGSFDSKGGRVVRLKEIEESNLEEVIKCKGNVTSLYTIRKSYKLPNFFW